MKPKIAAVAAALALLLTACGKPTDAVDVSGGFDPRTAQFPFAAYTTTPEAMKIFQTARIYVEVDCLRSFGFEVTPWEPEGVPPMRYDRFGLWNAEDAKTIGYAAPPLPAWAAVGGVPDEAWVSHVYDGLLSGRDGAQQVDAQGNPIIDSEFYNGMRIPDGGCQGEGLRAIHDPKWDSAYLSRLEKETGSAAMADSAVRAAVDEWASCMDDEGYDYTDPFQPFQEWMKERGTRQEKKGDAVPPSAEELAAATHDLSCKYSTGLLSTWVEAEIAQQNKIIAREGEVLAQWKGELDAALDRARAIITEHES